MDKKIKKINDMYGHLLENYKYINMEEELFQLPANTHLIYIHKNDFVKKSGYLIKFNNDNIFQVINLKKKWHVYIDQHYIFRKIEGNMLKIRLQKLLETNFKSLKNKKETI
jgi:hypothetical protein